MKLATLMIAVLLLLGPAEASRVSRKAASALARSLKQNLKSRTMVEKDSQKKIRKLQSKGGHPARKPECQGPVDADMLLASQGDSWDVPVTPAKFFDDSDDWRLDSRPCRVGLGDTWEKLNGWHGYPSKFAFRPIMDDWNSTGLEEEACWWDYAGDVYAYTRTDLDDYPFIYNGNPIDAKYLDYVATDYADYWGGACCNSRSDTFDRSGTSDASACAGMDFPLCRPGYAGSEFLWSDSDSVGRAKISEQCSKGQRRTLLSTKDSELADNLSAAFNVTVLGVASSSTWSGVVTVRLGIEFDAAIHTLGGDFASEAIEKIAVALNTSADGVILSKISEGSSLYYNSTFYAEYYAPESQIVEVFNDDTCSETGLTPQATCRLTTNTSITCGGNAFTSGHPAYTGAALDCTTENCTFTAGTNCSELTPTDFAADGSGTCADEECESTGHYTTTTVNGVGSVDLEYSLKTEAPTEAPTQSSPPPTGAPTEYNGVNSHHHATTTARLMMAVTAIVALAVSA